MSPSDLQNYQRRRPAAKANQPPFSLGDDGGAQSEQTMTADIAQTTGLHGPAHVDRGECQEGGFSHHDQFTASQLTQRHQRQARQFNQTISESCWTFTTLLMLLHLCHLLFVYLSVCVSICVYSSDLLLERQVHLPTTHKFSREPCQQPVAHTHFLSITRLSSQ